MGLTSRMQVVSIERRFDRRSFRSTKVDSVCSLRFTLKTAFPRRAITSRNHYTTHTQHRNFYYYLYAWKTEVFLIIYSSIELTLVFDRTDFWFRSKRPSIETTCYQHNRMIFVGDVSGFRVATNSHVCVFQTLAFMRFQVFVAGIKSRPIVSFALASIWHEQSLQAGTRATEW